MTSTQPLNTLALFGDLSHVSMGARACRLTCRPDRSAVEIEFQGLRAPKKNGRGSSYRMAFGPDSDFVLSVANDGSCSADVVDRVSRLVRAPCARCARSSDGAAPAAAFRVDLDLDPETPEATTTPRRVVLRKPVMCSKYVHLAPKVRVVGELARAHPACETPARFCITYAVELFKLHREHIIRRAQAAIDDQLALAAFTGRGVASLGSIVRSAFITGLNDANMTYPDLTHEEAAVVSALERTNGNRVPLAYKGSGPFFVTCEHLLGVRLGEFDIDVVVEGATPRALQALRDLVCGEYVIDGNSRGVLREGDARGEVAFDLETCLELRPVLLALGMTDALANLREAIINQLDACDLLRLDPERMDDDTRAFVRDDLLPRMQASGGCRRVAFSIPRALALLRASG